MGALTSTAYRFRARPWDIEGSGTVCTLCPSQCNVELTVRDDAKVLRVLARDNEDVDDGWLCDKGRFGYQAFRSPERITAPLVRDGGFLREVSWERALSEARPRSAALRRAHRGAGRRRRHQRGGLPRPAPAAQGARVAARRLARWRAGSTASRRASWRGPTCRRRSPTSTTPTRSSCSRPSWSTRRRSSTCACARRCAATARSWWWRRRARPRSTRNAAAALRFAPGAGRGGAGRAGGRAGQRRAPARNRLAQLAGKARALGGLPARRDRRDGAREPGRRRPRRGRRPARRRRRRRDLGRARGPRRARRRGASRRCSRVAGALGIAGKRGVRADRGARRRQRARPARGRLPADARARPRGRRGHGHDRRRDRRRAGDLATVLLFEAEPARARALRRAPPA